MPKLIAPQEFGVDIVEDPELIAKLDAGELQRIPGRNPAYDLFAEKATALISKPRIVSQGFLDKRMAHRIADAMFKRLTNLSQRLGFKIVARVSVIDNQYYVVLRRTLPDEIRNR